MEVSRRVNEDNFCCFRALTGRGYRVIWELVTRCNLRCAHCFYEEHVRSTPNERISQIVQALVRASPSKVILSGGEPLLHPRLFEAIEGLAGQGILVDVTTNATLLDKASAVRLKESGCEELSVSLDGASEEAHSILRPSGTFMKALEGIRHALNAGLKVDLVCGVVPASIDAIHEWALSAPALGVASLTLINIFQSGRGASRTDLALGDADYQRVSGCVEALRNHLTQIPVRTVRLFKQSPLGECPSGRSMFYIDVAGRLGQCRWTGDRRAMAIDWSRPEALGHALDALAPAISQVIPAHCRDCDLVEECGFGCPAGRGARGVDVVCDRIQQ